LVSQSLPFGNLTPLGKTCPHSLPRVYTAGQNCFVYLIGDVCRKRNKVLFCFGRNGKRNDKRPNGTVKHSFNRMPVLLKPSPPFASQMPPPPRGKANPASPSCRHSDGIAVGARIHEGDFRGCDGPTQTKPVNIPLAGFQAPSSPLRHLLRKCHLPRGGRLIPHLHLAGTQTALPSVPVPTKVSFVVVPAPFWGLTPFREKG